MPIENATPAQLLASIGVEVVKSIKARIRNGMVRPPKKRDDGRQTLIGKGPGGLMASIHSVVQGDTVIIGTNLKYARIQHEGGIIRPKHGKYLAIPLTPAAEVKKPREWTDTWIASKKYDGDKSAAYIMHTGANGKPEALYLLKKSVTLPARPYMFIDEPTMVSLAPLFRRYLDARFAAGHAI